MIQLISRIPRRLPSAHHERIRRFLNGSSLGQLLREAILGGQDGIVNVLGIVLGMAAATNDSRLVIIAGLAALVAESISMGAVAYTSTQAARQFFLSKIAKEQQSINKSPDHEIHHLRKIFSEKGFHGTLLNNVVETISRNRNLSVKTIVREEFGLSEKEFQHPVRSGIFVLLATTIGSLIPLLPFFVFPVELSVVLSLLICAGTLFIVGWAKSKLTTGNPLRNGLELMIIGMAAALFGWLVGHWLGVNI